MSGMNTFVVSKPVAAGGGASDAEDVAFTPAGGIEAEDVQAAIEELDTEKMSVADPQVSNDLADTTLSGTPIILCWKNNAGTPHYFKAYPTKA